MLQWRPSRGVPLTQREPVPLDYADHGLRPPRKRTSLIELLVLVGIIGVLIDLALPALSSTANPSTTVRCLSQLRSLGVYLQQYAATEHAFPDRLETLFEYVQRVSRSGRPVAQDFCCPKSGMAPAAGATTQAVRTDFAAGPKSSYTYLADGMPLQTRADVVVMIETAGNHSGSHTTLFADGHAHLLAAAAARQVLAQAAAGVRPVLWPTRLQPATQPAK